MSLALGQNAESLTPRTEATRLRHSKDTGFHKLSREGGSNMKVLIFPGFLKDKWSAIEQRYVWLNEPINEIGECHWLVPVPEEWKTLNQLPLYAKHLENMNARVCALYTSGKFHATTFRKIYRALQEIDADIVYTHFSPLRHMVELAATMQRRIVVRGEHNFAFEAFRRGKFLKRQFLKRTTSFYIPVSKAVAHHLVENGVMRNNYRVVYDGFDFDRFPDPNSTTYREKILSELGLQDNTRLICCIAKISRGKGQDLLLDMLNAIEDDTIHLLLVGDTFDPDYMDEIIRKSNACNLQKNVHFLGFREDVREILGACEISCLPSISEGLGNVVIESLAMGTPVISSDLPALREIVSHGENGFLVPERNPDAYADFTKRLLQDRSLKAAMGSSGYASVRRTFGKDAFVSATIDALGAAFASRGG